MRTNGGIKMILKLAVLAMERVQQLRIFTGWAGAA